jgi:hypothetical protein
LATALAAVLGDCRRSNRHPYVFGFGDHREPEMTERAQAYLSLIPAFLIAAALWLMACHVFVVLAKAETPLCGDRQVQCYDPAKIEAAYISLRNRGIRVDRSYIVSIEMNRGKFASAKALADWIERGDE